MSALNQISGNSFAGLTTINTDLTIEGNLDVNGSIEFSDITMGNALITGDLVVIGSILEQNTSNNLLTLTVTNGTLLNCTISNLKLTNLTADNILLTNLTVSNSNLTNSKITNSTATNILLTNLTVSNSNLTNSTITNSTATNILLTNLTSSKAFITDITATNLVLTNASSTNLSAGSAVITNSTIGSITNVSNVNFANRKLLINATGANLNPSNFTVGSLVISANNDITNSTKSGCYISNIEFDAAQTYSQVLNYNSTSKEITYKPYVYGSFISTTDQVINQTVANLVTLSTTLDASGITLATNKLTVSQAGYYKINFRAHITGSAGASGSATLFLKKNGTNVANSGMDVYVPGNNTENSISYETIVQLNNNDYIEAAVYTANSNLTLSYSASTASTPAVPGVAITMYQVS